MFYIGQKLALIMINVILNCFAVHEDLKKVGLETQKKFYLIFGIGIIAFDYEKYCLAFFGDHISKIRYTTVISFNWSMI